MSEKEKLRDSEAKRIKLRNLLNEMVKTFQPTHYTGSSIDDVLARATKAIKENS